MSINRAVILVSLSLGFLLPASYARSASTENYCILGSGDGLNWNWEVRFFSSLAVEIDRCSGAAMAPVGAPASDIRDILVSEINSECGIVVTAKPYSGVDCASDPGLTVDGYFAFELWLEEKVPTPPGPLLQVTASTPVQFNPVCYVDVPEPAPGLLLGIGIPALVGLCRLRRPGPRIP